MKRNVILLPALALALTFGFSSCKPKQSAYRAAMERAQQREVAAANTQQDQIEPVITAADEDSFRPEKVRPAAGESEQGLRSYSVVIGAFTNLTNARSLKERMLKEGYTGAMLAQNEQGMYRVIVTSFDTKEEAISSRRSIQTKYPGHFADAWILKRAY